MSAADLRGKTDAELGTELLDLAREAFNLRMQKGTGQLGRSSQIKTVRRNIARIKTLQNERRKA
ncbi:MAG: large subunit ribosomal protein L29 [Gammaproteobacteria bacterium]|jgi:large subunit ribosomal protein L29